MTIQTRHVSHAALKALIRPLARLCLERGVRLKECEQLLREVLVEEAQEIIRAAENTVSASKVSVATGLHRLEVMRFMRGEERPTQKHDVLNRVIGLWSQAKRYRTPSGEPRALTFEGTGSEFAALLSEVTKESSHYPILFELERLGLIQYRDRVVELRVVDYTPSGDSERGFELLSADVADLTKTVEQNVTEKAAQPNLHLRTVYDNIHARDLELIRTWLVQRGAEFHARIREFLSQFDRDITPAVGADGAVVQDEPGVRTRVAVTTFSHTEVEKPPRAIKPKKRGRKVCAPK